MSGCRGGTCGPYVERCKDGVSELESEWKRSTWEWVFFPLTLATRTITCCLMSADEGETLHSTPWCNNSYSCGRYDNISCFAVYGAWEDIQREVSAYLPGSLISYNTVCFQLSEVLGNTVITSPCSNNCVCYGWWNNLNIRWCAKQNLINTPPKPHHHGF